MTNDATIIVDPVGRLGTEITMYLALGVAPFDTASTTWLNVISLCRCDKRNELTAPQRFKI
jgi:hypothetical protein